MAALTNDCPVCFASFTPKRKDQVCCGPRCKETAKKRRKRSNAEYTSRELQAQRLRYQKISAECRLGFTARDGYTGPSPAPRKFRPARIEVDCVIDLEDGFSDLVFSAHPLPVGGPAQLVF